MSKNINNLIKTSERIPSSTDAKRILLYTEAWGYGGIESFIMNLIRTSPSEKFSFDIFSTWSWNTAYDDELINLGVTRYCIYEGFKPNLFKRSLCGVRQFSKLLANDTYDIVHINTMNGYGLAYSKVAKSKGVPTRIVHSHNSSFGEGSRVVKNFIHEACKIIFKNSPTKRLACSTDAGNYLFDQEYTVVNNGIDVNRYSFNTTDRTRIRNELGIDDSYILLGNIGRLSYAKNPLFQIKIFKEFSSLNPNSKFLMLGSGELDKEIEMLINNLCIKDKVIRMPSTPDPQPYYSAIDAFIFPSLYEGLGIAILESQCAGLPTFISKHLPKEVDITPNIHRLSISDEPKEWATSISHILTNNINRADGANLLHASQFDVNVTTAAINKIYSESQQ